MCVIIGDDTHEIFEPDEHIPAVDVFAGSELPWVGWPGRVRTPEPAKILQGVPELGEHLTKSFCEEGYDVSLTRKVAEGKSVGHAFDFIYSRIMDENVPAHVPIWLTSRTGLRPTRSDRCPSGGPAINWRPPVP